MATSAAPRRWVVRVVLLGVATISGVTAAAIGALRGEAANIQTEITRLLDQMNSSIRQADEFIKTLPQ